MDYTLENGHKVTDAQLENMAAEWENDTWEGPLENIVLDIKRTANQDEMIVESFRVPKTRVAAIESIAKERGISKSEFYRRAIDRELAALA